MKIINRFKGFFVIYLITILTAFGMVARVNVLEQNNIASENLIVVNE